MKSDRPKIVLCGEVFSPNLGDQAIAVCMKHLITAAAPHCSIALFDLSGRSCARGAIRETGTRVFSPFRSLRQFGPFPRRILNALVWLLRERRRFMRAARAALRDADLLIVGGGQLLADNDWAFPLRLAALNREAARAKVSTVVFACGVGAPRSKLGTILMRRFLSRAASVAVRDSDSLNRLKLFGVSDGLASLTVDPAIICGTLIAPVSRDSGALVGIGVIAPNVLVRHSASPQRGFSWWLTFWIELAREIRRSGIPCEFFTNGDKEDLEFAQSLQKSAARVGVEMNVRHPATPQELVQTIGSYRAIVGHRLHASIIAFSTGTPSVGLQWDSKLKSFYKRIDSERLCIDPCKLSVSEIARLISEVASESSTESCLKELSEELEDAVKRVIWAALPQSSESQLDVRTA